MNPLKTPVKNRGIAPDEFLTELLTWGKCAPDEIFAPNKNPFDIYADIKPKLGPWTGPLHRRAALLETMRVVAGFESSWNWNEGVDITNHHSIENLTGEETGIFQISFDSTWIADNAMKPFAEANNIDTPELFIVKMKSNHRLALEYFARLSRINIRWDGPLIRHEVDPWLSRDAVDYILTILTNPET